MGGHRPEGRITGTRNTRMGETNIRQRRLDAPFERGQGAEWAIAPHMGGLGGVGALPLVSGYINC